MILTWFFCTQIWTSVQWRYRVLPKSTSNTQNQIISIYMGLICEMPTFGINGQAYWTVFYR